MPQPRPDSQAAVDLRQQVIELIEEHFPPGKPATAVGKATMAALVTKHGLGTVGQIVASLEPHSNIRYGR